MLRGASGPTPAADEHLEPGIFRSRLRGSSRTRSTGRLAHAARIVIPRTSDADYKCFLYLREFVRRGVTTALAPVVLFDLLQSRGADVPAYDAARMRALLDELSSASGRTPSADDLREEIARANAARAAARRLVASAASFRASREPKSFRCSRRSGSWNPIATRRWRATRRARIATRPPLRAHACC